MDKRRLKKPSWIRQNIPGGPVYTGLKSIINREKLHTVCLEARCPNQGECFQDGTATFIILGNTCTRNCLYCSVNKGIPVSHDIDEPKRVARAIKAMGLKYAVITSVTRDDLDDGGAETFVQTVKSGQERIFFPLAAGGAAIGYFLILRNLDNLYSSDTRPSIFEISIPFHREIFGFIIFEYD